MKRLLPILSALLLLAACGPAEAPASERDAAESPAAEGIPPADGSLFALLEPADGREFVCDGMVPALIETRYVPHRMQCGDGSLYSVKKLGRWGLLDETGEEILPCLADFPFRLCGEGHWIAEGYSPPDLRTEERLKTLTGREICPGHESACIAYRSPADGGGIQVCTAGKGSFSMEPFSGTAPDQPAFPVFRPAGPLEPGRENPNLSAPFGHWNFSDAAGNLLAEGMEFDRVGWFNGEKLAPVCKDGKWAYLDAEGNLVTDFVYDACWDSQWAFDENTREYREISPCAAYSLTGGYAPVCREGKWGVIDETGREIVPTLYGGAAPYPGGAWLADGDVWRLFLF